MSTSENEGDLIVGKDGAAGYMNAEEREVFEEANPDLAAYSSLKFKVDDDDDEASESTQAVGAMADTLKGAGEEISRLRQKAEGHDLATGVGDLLDLSEEAAETIDDWDEQEVFRQQAQLEALQHAAAIEDEELRQRTFANLEERVDEDLYQAFATHWQQAYAAQTEADLEEGWAQAQKEAEQQVKAFEAVVTLENDLLNTLSPLEQACATKILANARDDIAQMPPADAQEALRTVMEVARDAAGKMETAATQEAIIKAHGRTKGGLDGRQLRETGLWQLGLLPSLEPTVEEVEAASARAQKGVKIDRQKAKRIHRGTGATGIERLEAQQMQVAKALGVPVHDAATGRRIG